MVFAIYDTLHASIGAANNVALFQVANTAIAKGSDNFCIDEKRTTAGASDDFDVCVDGEHTFLSSPLVYDFEPVGVAFVCVSERLYVLLGVDRRAVA